MNSQTTLLHQHLDELKLPFLKAQYAELAQQAAQHQWTHVEYLARLIDGQYQQRRQHTVQLRLRAARFPVVKTLEQFQWDWPKKANRLQVQNLFRLDFLAQKANVIFLGNVNPPTHCYRWLCCS
jgi:DNA replication protein DnaC